MLRLTFCVLITVILIVTEISHKQLIGLELRITFHNMVTLKLKKSVFRSLKSNQKALGLESYHSK